MSTYLRCARAFAEFTAAIGAEQWDSPGLGTWSVRTLVGHTGRSLDTVVTYLGAPEPADINTPTAVDYYLTLTKPGGPLAPGGDTSAIDARAVAAGEALGADPVAAVAAKIADVERVLADQPDSRRIEVIFGLTLPLAEYLRTRVFELVVHTMDLGKALGVPHGMPRDAVADMTRMAGEVAASTDAAEKVLFALAGRDPLPAGFSVV